MVDGNLLESIPAPFPFMKTLYIVVSIQETTHGLDASSYLTSLMSILTRFDEQLARVPPHRRIVVSHSSLTFDPFITDDDAVMIRFNGFVQTLSFLILGNTNALAHILHTCIEMYIRLSVCIDLTTSDDEEMPPPIES